MRAHLQHSLSIHTIREALQRDGAVFEMRQQILGSSYVVVDDLSLGESAFRIQYFVEIRDADLLVIDLQLLFGFRFVSRRSGHGCAKIEDAGGLRIGYKF